MSKDRISKVTTRAGDKGTTKTATGKTLKKGHPLITAVGSVDELNSHIGMLLALLPTEHPTELLNTIQQALFDIGAVLTMEGAYQSPTNTELEEATETLNGQLPPLTEFVLPRGGKAASQAHICRTVCRRAEADTWTLLTHINETEIANSARYLNRLSDYFFVLARSLSLAEEQLWQGPSS